ncbi:MAG: c(7)-type cytochrome triheme domain-containing protein [Motiliproteus sp.]
MISNAHAADLKNGNTIVSTKGCIACHKGGVMGAPKIGSAEDWKPRVAQGANVLVEHALKGFNSMPARGGNPTLKDNEIVDAIAYMLDTAGLKMPAAGAAKKAAAKPVAKKAAVKPAAAPKAVAAPKKKPAKIKFNRLMKSTADRNPPPVEDGIHDVENEGTYQLQPPREGMAGFAKSISGNYVDWVKTLNDGTIEPRFDRLDPTKKPFVMDLNIVREVKGSMPDVVYPHKQHTQWLDCSNCHPDIFIPKKGANQISMAAILLGEKCGVCHGKVAFPVNECKRCHSKKKKSVAFKE